MFDIYIKDYNDANGKLVSTETLVQTIPAEKPGDLKLISPIVKAEMGSAESFNFDIEGGTKFYDSFHQMKTFMRVVYDGETIFYGRVLSIENGFYGTRKLRLEGPLAFLNDTSIEGIKEESRTKISVYSYLSRLINNHNSMVADSKRTISLGEVPGDYSSNISFDQRIDNAERKFGEDNWTDTKAAVEDLRSHYGGYLRVHCNGHKGANNTYVDDGHYLDWMNHYFNKSENTQTIEVGKNVIDISTSTEIDNIFTVVIPIGNSKTTSYESADGTKKSTGPKHFYIDGREMTVPSICKENGGRYSAWELNSGYHTHDDYANAIKKYGRIVKTVVFDDAETAQELYNKCQEWIKNNYQGEVTKFTIKAVDMHQIGDKKVSKISVGDRVRIIYPVIKENGKIEKKELVRTCLSISYDLYNPENNQYTFGIPANILTKSYGVTKQGKKAQTASSSPKVESSGGGSTKTVEWLDKVTDWLAHHKICYKHKADGRTIDSDVYNPSASSDRFPWQSNYVSYEKGPYTGTNYHRNYFYDVEYSIGVGQFTLWKFTPNGEGKDFDQHELDQILFQIDQSMAGYPDATKKQAKQYAEKEYRRSREYHSWNRELITLHGILTHELIVNCNIIQYVQEEYGYDLSNMSGVTMPNLTYTDENGVQTTVVAGEGGKLVTKEMFKPDYKGDLPAGFHIVNTKNGRSVASVLDEDGNWRYWEVDKEGNVVETSIRELKWYTDESKDFRGSMIKEGYAGEDGEIHIYKFGQEIEKWANGEIVVASVDGDVVQIGSRRTKWATNVAQNFNGTFLNSIEFIVEDSEDPRAKKAIRVGSVGQASYIAKYDETLHCYVWDKDATMADVAAGTHVLLTGDGFWDTNNLALQGGVQTVQNPDGTRVTYINSDRTVIGDVDTDFTVLEALKAAGVIIETSGGHYKRNALVAESIYTVDINGVKARLQTIESDYITTQNLSSHIAHLDIVTVQSLKSTGDVSGKNIRCNNGDIYLHRETATGMEILNVAMSSAVWSAKITLSDNIYTLKLYDMTGSEITKTSQYTPQTFSRAISAFSGSWSGKTLTVTATPQNQTWVKSFQLKNTAWSGAQYTIYFDTYTPPTTGGIVVDTGEAECKLYHTILVSSLISAITADTLNDIPGSNTRSTVTIKAVNSENTQLKAADFTISDPTTYYYTTSGSDNRKHCVNLMLGNTLVGRKDIEAFYTTAYSSGEGTGKSEGWNAARNVVVNNFPTTTNTSRTGISIIYPSATPMATGEGNDLSRAYTMMNYDNDNVDLRTPVGTSSITVARFPHNKYTSAWNAARKIVTDNLPQTANTSNTSIAIKYPSATVGGTTPSQVSYYLSEYDKNTMDIKTSVNGTAVTVARKAHNQWTAGETSGKETGWAKAYGKTSVPRATATSNSYTVKNPAQDYDTQSVWNYKMVNTSGSDNIDKVDLQINTTGSTWVTVARFTHGRYSGGWTVATSKVNLPTTENTSNTSIAIKYPSATVGTSEPLQRSYYLSEYDKNTIDIKTSVNGTAVTVARKAHNQWTAGYEDGSSNALSKLTTSIGNVVTTGSNGRLWASSYRDVTVKNNGSVISSLTQRVYTPWLVYTDSTPNQGSFTSGLNIALTWAGTELGVWGVPADRWQAGREYGYEECYNEYADIIEGGGGGSGESTSHSISVDTKLYTAGAAYSSGGKSGGTISKGSITLGYYMEVVVKCGNTRQSIYFQVVA